MVCLAENEFHFYSDLPGYVAVTPRVREVLIHIVVKASQLIFCSCGLSSPCVVGPRHHSMARPQVADRGTASFMEGSCE